MPSRSFLIAALVSDDRAKDAKDGLRELLKIAPKYTVDRAMNDENILRQAEEHRAYLAVLGLHCYKTHQMFQAAVTERVVR